MIWGQMVRPGWSSGTFRGRISRTWTLAELMVLQASRMTAQVLALGTSGLSDTGVAQAWPSRLGSPLPAESIQCQRPAWAWLQCPSDLSMPPLIGEHELSTWHRTWHCTDTQ